MLLVILVLAHHMTQFHSSPLLLVLAEMKNIALLWRKICLDQDRTF